MKSIYVTFLGYDELIHIVDEAYTGLVQVETNFKVVWCEKTCLTRGYIRQGRVPTCIRCLAAHALS